MIVGLHSYPTKGEGKTGGATGDEQPVLPELSEDENEEAARQSGREWVYCISSYIEGEGKTGGATGDEQPVLPELSEDENEEAARQSGREWVHCISCFIDVIVSSSSHLRVSWDEEPLGRNRFSHSLDRNIHQRSIYGLYIKSAPFFGDLKKFLETKNNSRFYILKLYFLLHYNQFSCSVTSLLNITLQSWCILFKIRKIDVYWPNRCFLLLS